MLERQGGYTFTRGWADDANSTTNYSYEVRGRTGQQGTNAVPIYEWTLPFRKEEDEEPEEMLWWL